MLKSLFAGLYGCCMALFALLPWQVLAQGSAPPPDPWVQRMDSLEAQFRDGEQAVVLQGLLDLRKAMHAAAAHGHKAEIASLIGRQYQRMGLMRASESAFQEALVQERRHGDSLGVARRLDQLGSFYRIEGQPSFALRHHIDALALKQEFGGKKGSIVSSYQYLARAYIELGELERAETYLHQALATKQALKDTTALGVIYLLFADIYQQQGRYEEAIAHYEAYIPKRRAQNNYGGLAINYLGLAKTYAAWGKPDIAEQHYRSALAYAQRGQLQQMAGQALLEMGELYRAQGQPGKARERFSQLIAETSGMDSRAYESRAAYNLAQLYAQEGDFVQAFQYMGRYADARDSMEAARKATQLEDLQARFELGQKDLAIAQLDQENRQGRSQRNALLLGLAALVGLLLALMLLYRSRHAALRRLRAEQAQTQALLLEKEQLLADLQSTHLQLVQSEKMASIGVMTAGIAHELNNPIGFIGASVAALKMDQAELAPLFEALLHWEAQGDAQSLEALRACCAALDLAYLRTEMQELMAAIEKGTARTGQIVQGLRTFARDSGEGFAPYLVEEGLDTALTLLHHKMGPGIVVEKHYACQRPVPCQVSRINQAFLNLLDNALHASGEAGRILLHTAVAGDCCRISISDSGPGVAPALRQSIFEPFFTTKPIGQGMGLGLSISYGIVQQHRGRLWVEDAPGGGSRFVMELPLVAGA